jgi:hypothetical protein
MAAPRLHRGLAMPPKAVSMFSYTFLSGVGLLAASSQLTQFSQPALLNAAMVVTDTTSGWSFVPRVRVYPGDPAGGQRAC